MIDSAIYYCITPINPHAHFFEVRCVVSEPAASGQRFALPAWIPGSYMIREFSKNLVSLRAESGGRAVALEQIDKHTWQAPPVTGPLTVVAEIYAWDLSVRSAHLDQTHGFFNPSSLCLRVVGQEARRHGVELCRPAGAGYADWRVATTLRPLRGTPRHGFGRYQAADYDELIDHPVEMGRFTLAQFSVCGVKHEVAITGRHDCDMARLVGDLEKICAYQIGLFGEPAPFDRYLFLVMAVGEGYGGLEHRSSTALLCARDDLPGPNMTTMTDAYRGFLGLCSHEYFHAWNVKRIKPAAFMSYDLDRENYTSMLWAFEGFTSYYDDLALVRSGVISVREYLDLQQKNITALARTPGRLKQSVAQSSFNAWTKYYRQDENSPNAIVSYYLKGGLIALALDCQLRSTSRVSLDDVMRALWVRFGKAGVGVQDDDIRLVAEELSGLKLKRFFAEAVNGTTELPLAKVLGEMGVSLTWKASPGPYLGVKLAAGAEARLASVFEASPAARAGLSAGDVIIAIDGIKVGAQNFNDRLARRAAGDVVTIHAFRRDELMQLTVALAPAPADQCELALTPKPGRGVKQRLARWLSASE